MVAEESDDVQDEAPPDTRGGIGLRGEWSTLFDQVSVSFVVDATVGL